MPALPPVTNVLLVRFKGLIAGQPWNNVMHLQYTGPAPGVPQLNTLASQALILYGNNYGPMMAGTSSLESVDMADLTAPTAAVGSNSVEVLGSRAGEGLSSQATIVVSWQINLRYRGGHPRSYFPFGVVTDLQSPRLWSDTFKTAVNAATTTFFSGMNALVSGTTTMKLVTVSYHSNHVLRPQPLVFTIQGHAIHPRVDTQRRRLGKENA